MSILNRESSEWRGLWGFRTQVGSGGRPQQLQCRELTAFGAPATPWPACRTVRWVVPAGSAWEDQNARTSGFQDLGLEA